MADDQKNEATESVFDNIRGTRDALTVKRVFGDPVNVGSTTIIPAARLAGGAGGGGGEGDDGKEAGEKGSGYGSGFGLGAYPVGVYEIRDGEAVWKPSVDVNRLAKGGQVLAGIIAICVALIFWSRRSCRD